MGGYLKGCVNQSRVLLTLVAFELLLHALPSLLPVELRSITRGFGIAHPVVGNVMRPNSSGVIARRAAERICYLL